MPSEAEAEAASGLLPNERGPTILRVSPGINLSWPASDANLTYTIPHGKYLIFIY